MLNFTIPVKPVTKKNSQQIIRLKNGMIKPLPSKAYRSYEKEIGKYLPRLNEPINWAVNIKAVYYMPTRRIVDLVNLNEALCDALVHWKMLKDDNFHIVESMDGCRVAYDKYNPRTEVSITW